MTRSSTALRTAQVEIITESSSFVHDLKSQRETIRGSMREVEAAIKRAQIQLADLEWIEQHMNVIIEDYEGQGLA